MAGRFEKLSTWVKEAIESTVRVILVHDQSQDATQLELEKLIRDVNSPLLTFEIVEVKSPGLARNAGLSRVTTPWFSFADADDFVEVSNLCELLHQTLNCEATIGIGGFTAHNIASGKEDFVMPPIGLQQELALHLAIRMGLWRIVFSTHNLNDIRFTPDRMAEDYWYLLQVLNRSELIHTSSLTVYKYYFGGPFNLTSNRLVMKDMFNIIKRINDFRPITDCARMFQIFASQKLFLSIVKNVPVSSQKTKAVRLFLGTLLHPIHWLYFARTFSRLGRKNEKL